MSARSVIAACLLGALVAFGCGSESQPEPDTAAPLVVRTEPVDGATGVDPAIKIKVWFDEQVDNRRVEWDDALHLIRADGVSLYGNGSYDLGQHVATLSLAIKLMAGQTYQVVLERGICDLEGNCMAEPVRWSFTVAP